MCQGAPPVRSRKYGRVGSLDLAVLARFRHNYLRRAALFFCSDNKNKLKKEFVKRN